MIVIIAHNVKSNFNVVNRRILFIVNMLNTLNVLDKVLKLFISCRHIKFPC